MGAQLSRALEASAPATLVLSQFSSNSVAVAEALAAVQTRGALTALELTDGDLHELPVQGLSR